LIVVVTSHMPISSFVSPVVSLPNTRDDERDAFSSSRTPSGLTIRRTTFDLLVARTAVVATSSSFSSLTSLREATTAWSSTPAA
jgi:hypothetical protein